ncbi:MAG: hypothetical protein LLF98_11560 [Clostridium sp.]|uniref:hypothetical protein n=1 Tax=Clostridium sp. TaxID=1506 RepID=UPI0025BBE1F1|nr:hypothetical protein [Clostridium sp.]MCE5221865.1 hypothetical protein [Clostridium sp.]
MDKELFDKTESQLTKYFSKEKIVKALKDKIFLLDKQIKSIDQDLRTSNISIEPESKSPSFEERVQTSSDGMGYAEREVMRVTELKIRRKTEKQLEREKVLEQLDNIEIEYNEIEWKIKDFTGELRILLELKYKNGLGENAIAERIHLSQSQVNRIKQQIIRKISMWDGWGKRCIKVE